VSPSSIVPRRALLGLVCACASACITACTVGEPLTPSSPGAPLAAGSTTPAEISVSPAAVTVKVGGKVAVAAAVTNTSGQPVSGASIAWTAANPAIATVTTTGMVTAVATGTTTVSATINGLTATTPVNVVPAATATATLGSTAQAIKGWGMYPAGGSALYSRPTIRNAIYATGLTFIRTQIDPATYQSGSTLSDITINTNTLVILEQQLQEAQAQGIDNYIISIWSPPASMKTNHSTLGMSGGVAGQLDSTQEGAFVAYVTRVLMTLRTDGLPLPQALSIQNEPDFAATSYSGCTYSVAQWTRVIEAMRVSFDANGLGAVLLFGPETGTYGGAVYSNASTYTPGYFGGPGFPSLASDATFNHAVGAYAFHTYGECQIAGLNSGLQAVPKDAWMTEFSEPNGTTETAWTLDMLAALGAHLALVPNNYWAWWNGYADVTTPDNQTLIGGDQTPVYSKRYWALKALWTTVRPGWLVTHMTTTDNSLLVSLGSQDPCAARVDLVAFTRPDKGAAAVLMVNPTTQSKLIAVGGLPGSTAQIYRTDANANMAAQPPATITGGVATIPLPPNSAVLTVAQ
jgi:O-glycosyl hydrolase